MAGESNVGWKKSTSRFKDIVSGTNPNYAWDTTFEQGLLGNDWYDAWFPGHSIKNVPGESYRRANLKMYKNRGPYIQGLATAVQTGDRIIEETGSLSPTQQADYDASKLALQDLVGDEELKGTEADDVQQALLNGRTVLSEEETGDISELPERNIVGALTTQPGAKAVRLAHQCFLLYNIESFSKYHRQLLGGALRERANNPPFYTVPAAYETDTEATSTRSRGIVVETSGYYSQKLDTTRMYLVSDDSTESALTNKLSLRKHGDKFVNMQTSELSQLIPRLRLFKVYRENNDKRVVEIEFKPTTNLNTPTGLNKKIDIQYLGATQNKFIRGDDVGLKSFDWEFVGSDPFTATREVAATLSLTAQHFSSYVRKRQSTPVGAAIGDEGEYRYLDLVLQPDCRDTREQNYENFSPECYEIRVEVGYNGGDKTFGTFKSDGEFKETVRCHKDTLILSPTHHKFEFNEDGSVELQINLRGRLDALMNDKMLNVLMPNGGAYASSMQVNLSMIDPVDRDEIPALKGNVDAYVSLSRAEDALKYVTNNKKKNKDLEAIGEKLQIGISKMYVSQKQLFLAHIFDKLDTGGAVHTYIMEPDEKTAFAEWDSNVALSALPPIVSLSHVQHGGRPDASISVDRGGVSDELSGEFAKIMASVSAPNQEKLNQRITRLQEQDPNVRMNNVVNYIFLGDLLAVVIDSITGENTFQPGEITNIVLTGEEIAERETFASDDGGYSAERAGEQRQRDVLQGGVAGVLAMAGLEATLVPLTVLDVLDTFRVILGNLNLRLRASGKNQVTNLAHIPISVPLFNEFMIEHVLSKDVTNYPFFEFVNNLISSLVVNTLGTKCFGGLLDTSLNTQTLLFNSPENIEENRSLFNIQKAAVVASPAQSDPGVEGGESDSESEASESDTMSEEEADEFTADYRGQLGESSYRTIDPAKVTPSTPILGNCGEQQINIFEYLFIGTQTIDPSALNGNYEADKFQGIYHLGYGLDRGLVKTMKFAKTNQEFLPEAQFASEGGLLLNQLSNAFDVSIEMVGNNLFKIGQYVYLDAEALGAGPSWADFTTGVGGSESLQSGASSSRSRSYANIMGLGGYHLITEVANSISDSGVYTTTIKARWQDAGTRPDWPDAILV